MISRCMITAAIAGFLAALAAAGGALAGSSSYDVAPLLNEPHPFAQVPNALPPHTPTPLVAQTPWPPAEPYFRAGPAPVRESPRGPAREDTLLGLFGLSGGSVAPAPQVANSSVAAAPPSQIAAAGQSPARNGDPAFITIAGGWFDFNDNEQAAEFRLEWRGRKIFWIFKPFVGAIGTSDAAIYGYGGFLTDFFFGRRIVVTPSIAAGLYEDGDGKDLGSIIEFRSGLEIGWRFDNRSRLSAMVYHISNASISDNNPGTEVFSIGYSFPLH